jgi:TonB family protein
MNASGDRVFKVDSKTYLEVRTLWGHTVLDVASYPCEGRPLVVGENLFPASRQVGVRFENHTAHLSFIAKDNERISQTLQSNGSKTLFFGPVGFSFRYVERVPGFITRMTERLDLPFLNTLLVLLFFTVGLITTIHLRPKTASLADGELSKIPSQFVQFILSRPNPTPVELSFSPALKTGVPDKEKKNTTEGLRGPKGKAGTPGLPDTGRRTSIKTVTPDNHEIVAQKLAALNLGGQTAFAQFGTQPGLGRDLDNAIGNLTGTTPGSSGGFGGLGFKGTGPGGDGSGNIIAIGSSSNWTQNRGPRDWVDSKMRKAKESDVKISVGSLTMIDPLSKETIRVYIHQHREQIKYCYSRELARNQNIQGKVEVRFAINTKGFVTEANVARTTLENSAVESCITQKILTWKFPQLKGGGTVTVHYPFIFSPGS